MDYFSFTDDGDVDYNAEAEVRGLDPDFVQGERSSVYCERRPQTNQQAPKLCFQCQQKADYKVKALRDFEPTREERYEIELEIHERRLEMYCQPCPSCQEKLNRHLENISSTFSHSNLPAARDLDHPRTMYVRGNLNKNYFFRSIAKIRPTETKNKN